MPTLPPLVSAADFTDYGYTVPPVGKINAASARVRRFTGQQITAGTSTVTFTGAGPWLLPQRPATAIVSALDSDGAEITVELEGQYIKTTECPPFTVEYEHGWDVLPDALVELVCSIAARIAVIPDAMITGARTEQAGGETVTWGADSFSGTTGLTSAEEAGLRKFFPKLPRTAILL